MPTQYANPIPAQMNSPTPYPPNTYRYVPVRHQLNFVLCVSFFWTTFLSLAFPPGKAKAA